MATTRAREGDDGAAGTSSSVTRGGRLRFRAAVVKAARAKREAEDAPRSEAGPGATLAGRSLWTFGPDNRARRAVFRVMHSQTMEYAVLGVIATHFVTLVLLASSGESTTRGETLRELAKSPLRAMDAVVLCLYTAEAAARIFALGFIGHKHAYAASVYNQVDFLIIVVSWLSMAMRRRGIDSILARVRIGQLRLFRGVHALKQFKLATSVVFIAESLQKSISLLRDVAAVTVVCAVFYALMGMGVFGGSLRRRCVETTSAATASDFYTAVSDPPLFCGDVRNHVDDKGFVCPGVYDSNSSLFCSDLVGNPKHGYQSFDSFGSTLLVMFQTITIESWQEVMFPIVNAEYKASAAYFVTLIIVGTYFIVSVFVAAVSGVFLRLRREHQMMLRSRSKGKGKDDDDDGDDDAGDDFESNATIRRLIRRLNGGEGESVHSVAEAAMTRARLMRDDEEEPRAVPSGVARPKRDRLSEYVHGLFFDRMIKCLIACNAAVMALYRFDLDAEKKRYLLAAEGFFISAFMLEVVLRAFAAKRMTRRVCAMRPTNEDVLLLSDVFVVATSAAVMWNRGVNLTSLRIPRLFKTHGRARSRSGADTINRVFRSAGSLLSLFLFYVAILAMYAVLGMQLFANRNDGLESPPRLHFDTFPQAMLALFTVSTGEGWTELMFHDIQITKAAIPFYITFFILVNYIVLNLVIAVVLENLELRDVEKTIVQSEELVKRSVRRVMKEYCAVDFMERVRVKLVLTLSGRRWTTERANRVSPWLERRWEIEKRVTKRIERQISASIVEQSSDTAQLGRDFVLCESKFVEVKTREDAFVDAAPDAAPPEELTVVMKEPTNHDDSGFSVETKLSPCSSADDRTHRRDARVEIIFDDAVAEDAHVESAVDFPWYISNNALCLFPSSSRIRVRVKRVLRSVWYERLTFCVVSVSVIAVLATRPVDQENPLQAHVDAANYCVCGYFLMDFALNIVAHGFALTPAPYVARVWNLLDMGILVIDVMIVACPALLKGSYTRYWRRAFNMAAPLRPVRIMTRVKSMRHLAKSLIVTLPTIWSIIMLTGAMFLSFAIIGIREYGGTFYGCTDATVVSKSECLGTFVESSGEVVERIWNRHLFEFDWIGSAMLTLLETASLDNWTEIMFAAMDKTGVDSQPRFERNWPAAFFFVAFILFGSFLMIRTIIGVFIHQFGLISGRKLQTERQKLWHDMRKIALSLKPIRAKVLPPPGFRRVCFKIVNHDWYKTFVLITVSVNAGLMMTERYGDDGNVLARVRSIGEMCFVGIYLTEALLQVTAAYPSVRHYFSQRWNAFELFLAVGSAATLRSVPGSPRDQIGRPFRFLRVFRIIRHVQSLQILASTLVLAVPSILSVMGLMMIWIFVYAGVGTQVFPNVKYGVALNKDANFQSFTSSFLLLFQVVTGEGWRQYMYDLMIIEPECVNSGPSENCGYPDGAVIYFVTYVVAMGYIFTNLFVASILDHVTFGVLREAAIVTPEHLYDYQRAWSEHDPNATGFIGAHRLREFLRDVGPPLALEFDGELGDKSPAFRRHTERASALWRRRILYESITTREPGRGVPFARVLESLLAAKLGAAALPLDARLARRRQLRNIETWGAAVVAQAYIRGHMARRFVRTLRSKRRAMAAAVDLGPTAPPTLENF